MPRKPPTNVVVVTGVSSAIGQALALEFAVRGDAVVLAALSEELLDSPKRACEMLGAWTHGVVVSERGERGMRMLAKAALERFGRIDIWVNHAAPYARTGSESTTALQAEMAAFEQGARMALSYFENAGRGVLVNIDGYANMTSVDDAARAGVRAQFQQFAADGAKLSHVAVHNVVTTPGVVWQDLAKQVVGVARGEARGDAIGRAMAVMARQQMRLFGGARKARRKVARDAEAHTAVLTSMTESRRSSRSSGGDGTHRRGGWHLAHTKEGERTTMLMALIALPLLMAAGMLLLVRG